ncbi:MAG TPA: LysR family transcriptional regulator [Myxococcota bacterium]|nr:LysR family transcriptional regulator [Myxococcota bacterium]
MDWDDLRTFLAVARTGSLTEAARGLGVSYSTVSRRLAALEAGLGARLFERSGGGYVLTPAGSEMLESARRMEAEFDAFARRVQGRDARLSGRVRVATTDALATSFMPELAAFSRRFPDIEIDLISTPEPAELAMREAEVALLVTDRPPPDLVGRRLATLPSALYAANSYLAEHPAGLELAAHVWVGWEDGMAHIPAARWMREQVPHARVACRVSTGTALLAALQAGIGVGHLLCFLADEDPGLARLRPPEPALETGLWLLTHQDLRTTGRVRVFLDSMADAIGRHRRRLASGHSPARAAAGGR